MGPAIDGLGSKDETAFIDLDLDLDVNGAMNLRLPLDRGSITAPKSADALSKDPHRDVWVQITTRSDLTQLHLDRRLRTAFRRR